MDIWFASREENILVHVRSVPEILKPDEYNNYIFLVL